MSTYQVPFPSWKLMVPQIFCFFVFEDFFHFLGKLNLRSHVVCLLLIQVSLLAHQALHTRYLYKHIHKIHHKYSAPFGLAAEYAHPAEVFILGAGTVCGPLIYCYFTQNLHLFTVLSWIVLRLFQAVDAHSGYGQLPSNVCFFSHCFNWFDSRLPLVPQPHSSFLVWGRTSWFPPYGVHEQFLHIIPLVGPNFWYWYQVPTISCACECDGD